MSKAEFVCSHAKSRLYEYIGMNICKYDKVYKNWGIDEGGYIVYNHQK